MHGFGQLDPWSADILVRLVAEINPQADRNVRARALARESALEGAKRQWGQTLLAQKIRQL
jgi:hypothetical protein